MRDNLLLHTTAADFAAGEMDGTVVVTDGNGAVTLADGIPRGTFISPVVETPPFEYMVLSWGAVTPAGSYIEIHGRVRVGDRWSGWLSWGRWCAERFTGADGKLVGRGSASRAERDDELAWVDADELCLKAGAGGGARAFQYRLTLNAPAVGAGAPGGRPKVWLVACTLRNTALGQGIPKTYPGAASLSHLEVELDVPAYSQHLGDPKIADSICSPTCVSMVLAYYGVEVSPDEAAWAVRDYGKPMFGNWPFNTAYMAGQGLVAYVDYLTPADGADPWHAVKLEILSGHPVIISVRYRRPGTSGAAYPVVEGVPINSTGGHLIVVRGFVWRDGVEYVIVNDPAAGPGQSVRREYRADQLAAAWHKKVAYVTRRL